MIWINLNKILIKNNQFTIHQKINKKKSKKNNKIKIKFINKILKKNKLFKIIKKMIMLQKEKK